MNRLADAIRHPLECLLSGKTFALPQGKRARRTSEPTTCGPCVGKGRCLPDPRAIEEETCDACSGLGQVFEHVIEDDPMMLAAWTGHEFHPNGGFAERHSIDGERVAYVENDQGKIEVGLEPHARPEFTVHINTTITNNISNRRAKELTWAIALRLADAELRALGYREA